MHRLTLSIMLLQSALSLGLAGCRTSPELAAAHSRDAAVRYLRAVYAGGGEALGDLVAPDIVVSYPIFQERFGTPALQGREAVESFARGFRSRWSDADVVIDDSVVDGDTVVLLWSFRGRWNGSDLDVGSDAERAWGGITVIRFDGDGRVRLELGEESTPGPAKRLDEAGRH